MGVLLVGWNVNIRSAIEFEQALALLRRGLTPTDVARATGVPRSTVRDWAHGRGVLQVREGHDLSSLNGRAYAYLLGIYLGDGYICPRPRGVWQLRITLDSAYPGIVAECVSAVEAIAPGNAYVLRRRHDRAVEVSKYWKHWTCLIPQHGPGRKHARAIVLTDWQWPIVRSHVRAFVRGLIHSDGTRIIATERKGAYVRRAARYAFKNRSEDILQLFATACEEPGIHFTRPSSTQIAVYRRADVELLDEFVGPKS